MRYIEDPRVQKAALAVDDLRRSADKPLANLEIAIQSCTLYSEHAMSCTARALVIVLLKFTKAALPSKQLVMSCRECAPHRCYCRGWSQSSPASVLMHYPCLLGLNAFFRRRTAGPQSVALQARRKPLLDAVRCSTKAGQARTAP